MRYIQSSLRRFASRSDRRSETESRGYNPGRYAWLALLTWVGTRFAIDADMHTPLIKRYVWLSVPCALFAAACDDTAAAVDEEAQEESRELKQEMKEAERDAEKAAAEAKQDIKQAGREIEAGAKEAARTVERKVDAADKAVADEIRDEE